MEDEEVDDSDDRFAAEGPLESQHVSGISESTVRAASVSAESRARSVSARRRTVLSGIIPFRNNRPYSLALSANNSVSRFSLYPPILQNTGLRSPSPAFDFPADFPDTSLTPGNASNVDVLQPIIEGKPAGFEAQEVEGGKESVFSQLPLIVIFQASLVSQ
jgi:hypothetical protein